jgi:cytochrome c peroxidase
MIELLGMGTTLVLLASVVLVLLVQNELAPQGGLTGKGKWMLAAGLGTGIAAFTFKLVAIALFVTLPKSAVSTILATAPDRGEARYWSEPGATASGYISPRTGYVWQALPERAPVPAENPMSVQKIALGERLFHDPALSRNGGIACSSCHEVRRGAGIDGLRTSSGIDRQTGPRNAPTVWNAAFQSVLFWDGRAASLEEQAKGPMTNPLEMGMPSHELVEQRVRQSASYRAAFAESFGSATPITIERIVEAIAAYERTLITPDTPYDRFVRGDSAALSTAQLRGMALFEEVGCVLCHAGPNFSTASNLEQNSPYRIFPALTTEYDRRYELTADSGKGAAGGKHGVWRVPSLRNVALTAPYFHNGSVDTLEEAVRVMASAQLGHPRDGDPENGRTVIWSQQERTLKSVVQEPLSEEEVADIVAFLNALSSERLVNLIAGN